MNAPRIITLGCRLNAFESEVMRTAAKGAGLEDTIIVNTCTVTAEAERQARQAIRRARRDNPEARIVVTGCAAQVDPDRFAAMPEVDRVVGNVEKLDAALLGAGERIQVSDIMDAPEADTPLITGFEGRTRAFVQVQRGCDYRCTYCIVPFARGPSHSLPPEHVVEQVRELCDNGHVEVVLTGVDVCSYGTDLHDRPTLGGLAARILADLPNLARLRLTTVDPAAFDEDMFDLLAHEKRFMPHLHLSLQAADDMILKRMMRRHSRGDAEALCERIRSSRPDVVLGADLIAGFPTETEEMFQNTLAAIDDLGLTFLHVFPFSVRHGTSAARMPQVPVAVRKERAQRLRAAGESARAAYLKSCVGDVNAVILEKDRAGHTPHFAPVRLTHDGDPGSIINVRITDAAGDHLIGEKTA